ncbi:hypothetical protein OGAPHI_005738 [Ogataea philodendri]|uniref:Secreted protein n=1 Tax=Ogataea philodendri TaxID=1378263 RepID=A0A9P8P069_9ASCO|nr:uncharacterized protein OGAPHI_005738 [Ogataea philodendri]KAH3662486.1 hypothetical protein OGAPHI_005738 [Ogataea philodendri]
MLWWIVLMLLKRETSDEPSSPSETGTIPMVFWLITTGVDPSPDSTISVMVLFKRSLCNQFEHVLLFRNNNALKQMEPPFSDGLFNGLLLVRQDLLPGIQLESSPGNNQVSKTLAVSLQGNTRMCILLPFADKRVDLLDLGQQPVNRSVHAEVDVLLTNPEKLLQSSVLGPLLQQLVHVTLQSQHDLARSACFVRTVVAVEVDGLALVRRELVHRRDNLVDCTRKQRFCVLCSARVLDQFINTVKNVCSVQNNCFQTLCFSEEVVAVGGSNLGVDMIPVDVGSVTGKFYIGIREKLLEFLLSIQCRVGELEHTLLQRLLLVLFKPSGSPSVVDRH